MTQSTPPTDAPASAAPRVPATITSDNGVYIIEVDATRTLNASTPCEVLEMLQDGGTPGYATDTVAEVEEAFNDTVSEMFNANMALQRAGMEACGFSVTIDLPALQAWAAAQEERGGEWQTLLQDAGLTETEIQQARASAQEQGYQPAPDAPETPIAFHHFSAEVSIRLNTPFQIAHLRDRSSNLLLIDTGNGRKESYTLHAHLKLHTAGGTVGTTEQLHDLGVDWDWSQVKFKVLRGVKGDFVIAQMYGRITLPGGVTEYHEDEGLLLTSPLGNVTLDFSVAPTQQGGPDAAAQITSHNTFFAANRGVSGPFLVSSATSEGGSLSLDLPASFGTHVEAAHEGYTRLWSHLSLAETDDDAKLDELSGDRDAEAHNAARLFIRMLNEARSGDVDLTVSAADRTVQVRIDAQH